MLALMLASNKEELKWNRTIFKRNRERGSPNEKIKVSKVRLIVDEYAKKTAASSPTQHDECPVATSNQHITYTTAQLHESINKVLDVKPLVPLFSTSMPIV